MRTHNCYLYVYQLMKTAKIEVMSKKERKNYQSRIEAISDALIELVEPVLGDLSLSQQLKVLEWTTAYRLPKKRPTEMVYTSSNVNEIQAIQALNKYLEELENE